MKKYTTLSILFLCLTMNVFAQGKVLQFKFKEGDNHRILSTTQEIIKVNGQLHHEATIVNRVTLNVDKVDSKGRGHTNGIFMVSESNTLAGTGQRFPWSEEIKSEYWRDKNGVYEISDSYFMPIIRDMPHFPDRELKPGDTWTAQGYEAEDLRREPFSIAQPFKVPFVATYTYERDEDGVTSDSTHTKKTFQVISVRYSISYETPAKTNPTSDYPVSTMGTINRTIYWDNDKGQIDHADEQFRIIMETYLGNMFDFIGTTHDECTEFQRTSTEKAVKEVQEKVQQMGLENVTVEKSDKGLKISIENIQFLPNSAVLEDSEKIKLSALAKIIEGYPDNDLLINGHTARSGTEESCQQLSEERAGSVANYLIDLGVKDKYHIFSLGSGSRVPIATNKTKEGMAKNRRVEITILDR